MTYKFLSVHEITFADWCVLDRHMSALVSDDLATDLYLLEWITGLNEHDCNGLQLSEARLAIAHAWQLVGGLSEPIKAGPVHFDNQRHDWATDPGKLTYGHYTDLQGLIANIENRYDRMRHVAAFCLLPADGRKYDGEYHLGLVARIDGLAATDVIAGLALFTRPWTNFWSAIRGFTPTPGQGRTWDRVSQSERQHLNLIRTT